MPNTILEEFINLIGWQVDESSAQSAEKKVEQVFDNMKKGAVVLTASITAPIIAFASKSVQLAQIQRDAQGQLEQGLISTENAAGRTLEQLQDMASGIQGKTLFGDEDILRNVSANLITFTNVAEERFDRAQMAALDMSTRMKTDLKSSTLAVGKALNDPIKNLGALGRSGIQFSKEQEEVIKKLAETNRIAEAQEIILGELEKQFGGSAEAAARTSTGWTQMSNAVGDLQERIGYVLIPIIKKVTGVVQKFAEELQNVDDTTVETGLKIAFLVASIGPLMFAFIKLVSVGKAVISMWKVLNTAMTLAGTKAVLTQIKLMLIPIAILTIIAMIALLIQDYYVWKNEGDSVLGQIFGSYQAFTKALKEEFKGINDFFDNIIEQIVLFFYEGNQAMWEWVDDAKKAFNSLKNTVVSTFEKIINNPAVKATLDLLGIDMKDPLNVSKNNEKGSFSTGMLNDFTVPVIYGEQKNNVGSFGYRPAGSSNFENNFNISLGRGTAEEQAREFSNIVANDMQRQYKRALNVTSGAE